MSTRENQARLVAAKLSKYARELGVPYPQVLTEFLLERLASRLMGSKDLAGRLIFKGGYVSLRVYDSPRYTIDLDALLSNGNLESVIESARTAAEAVIGDAVWFRFEKSVDLETQGEYGGMRLAFRAGIGEILQNIKRAQVINLDIGKGDPIVPGPVDVETPFLLGGGILSWRVYPVETTVSEKLHALIVRGSASSRSKDIFDLNLLLPKCDSANLKKSLAETFRYRGEKLPADIVDCIKQIDTKVLAAGWKSAVITILNPSKFQDAFEELIRKLSQIY